MTFATANSPFGKGVRDGAPFMLVVAPFGMLFGVLAGEAGLKLGETMVFTITSFAGAAQFTALQLMQDDTPTVIVLVSALAVNLRLAMYSASLTPWLGAAPLVQRVLAAFFLVDQSYACAVTRYETEPDMTLPQRMRYYAGSVILVTPVWCLSTLAGAVLGAGIPESWALDFALPIAFISMIMPMMRTRAHVIAALVAVAVALPAAAVPYNPGLILAGFAGMVAGARAEQVIERRRCAP